MKRAVAGRSEAVSHSKDAVLMLRALWRASMTALLLAGSGCATPKLLDDIPPGEPRGYVAFHDVWLSATGLVNHETIPKIYSVTDGQEKLEWRLPPVTAYPSVVRIAKRPGTYHFSIRYAKIRKDVTVKVENGMVTPLRMDSKIVPMFPPDTHLMMLEASFFRGRPIPTTTWSAAGTNEWELLDTVNPLSKKQKGHELAPEGG